MEESNPNEHSDIPDASLVQGETVAANDTVETVSRSLIKVTTPLYHVWIDPVGGDIVGAKLIEFPVSLKEPDLPMTMLDRRVGRTYIAQSGLMGKMALIERMVVPSTSHHEMNGR